MLKSGSHVWHMVLAAGVVMVAIWLGAAWSTALLFATLTCAAMLGALVWFVVSSTRATPAQSFEEPRRRVPFAPPEADRR